MSRVKGWTGTAFVNSRPLKNSDVYVEEIPEGAIRTEAVASTNYNLDLMLSHDGFPVIPGKRYEVILILIPVEDEP